MCETEMSEIYATFYTAGFLHFHESA